MEQVITPPTTEQVAARAHLMGKLQTSLMRDGWAVTELDAAAGTLGIADVSSIGTTTFTLSLSIPHEGPQLKPAAERPRPRKKAHR